MGSTSTALLCGLHCHNVDGWQGCCCGCAACFPASFEVERRAYRSALSENISKKEHPHRDLSTALRFGRDDKGKR